MVPMSRIFKCSECSLEFQTAQQVVGHLSSHQISFNQRESSLAGYHKPTPVLPKDLQQGDVVVIPDSKHRSHNGRKDWIFQCRHGLFMFYYVVTKIEDSIPRRIHLVSLARINAKYGRFSPFFPTHGMVLGIGKLRKIKSPPGQVVRDSKPYWGKSYNTMLKM